MTEYNVASPLCTDAVGVNRFRPELGGLPLGQSHSHTGSCRAVRTSVEQFAATLNQDQEVAIRLLSGTTSVEFRPQEIRFSPTDVITFFGCTDTGEAVRLIQHVSQVNLLLKSVEKMGDEPIRCAFLYGGA